ncbi:TonB-dependent receptor plug domain-containing protein [Flocculibacter collagenilyticus]|uniref:TonB-dependent receptor plug domain-containing protein n=1 Tax=Flocculibacter collagenilyticus TaxID=2744479 RepID=UPI0018F3D25A|nr:TonB-dependent receptor plug domain-containing protein [Flocculibacter collagenilyticus]
MLNYHKNSCRISVFCALTALAYNTGAEAKQPQDVFSLSLDELLNVDVNVSSTTESRQQFLPASVTVIHRSEIQYSGGRTLNDVLNLYVPGYFKAEDKDDTIGAFRGVAPDNNSKVLLLIDGIKVNADWFWGPADSVLNGIGLDYIERIEVVRGPGSVMQGQGAQLGVINIITRNIEEPLIATASAGEYGWHKASVMGGGTWNDLRWQWYLSRQLFDGIELPQKGWAIEIQESDSSHPNPPALRGNKLNHARATRFFSKLTGQSWKVQLQHHQQIRDLYNWTKDRDQVEQRLTFIAAEYHHNFNEEYHLTYTGNWQVDDYGLYDLTTGETTGGAREQRGFLKLQLGSNQPIPRIGAENDTVVTSERNARKGINWVVAAELEYIKTGDSNWQGDNFIVNRTAQLTEQVNQTHTWLFEETFLNKALIAEITSDITPEWHINLGARYDHHEHWGNEFTPRLSVSFAPAESETVYRLSYQKGFRGPPGVHYTGGFLRDGLLSEDNLDQLEGSGMTSSSDGSPAMNAPSPKTETLKNYEFAIKGKLSDFWQFDAVFFYNEIEDFILTLSTRNGTPEAAIGTDTIGSWGGVFYYANQPGKIKLRGVELSSIWQSARWKHQISYSTHDVISADGFALGMKSPVAGTSDDINANGMPESIWRYSSQWKFYKGWTLAYQHISLADWWAPWTNSKETGINWGNVSIAWDINRAMSLRLVVHNVWDERGLYPIRARGKLNEDPGTPAVEPRNAALSFTYTF